MMKRLIKYLLYVETRTGNIFISVLVLAAAWFMTGSSICNAVTDGWTGSGQQLVLDSGREHQNESGTGRVKEVYPVSRSLSAVVETRRLSENINAPDIRKIFVDNWPSDRNEFDKGHIYGSAFMGVDYIMGAIGDGSAPPDSRKFEKMMQDLGIADSDHVILYGAAGDSVFTLGAFWIMDYFRHGNTGYLNGGLKKWKNEKLEISKAMKEPVSSKYVAGVPDESIRADAAYVLNHLTDPDVVLVDVRSTGEYKGEENVENNKRTGHIPGAVNINYYNANFNADGGTLKLHQDLQTLYDSKGVTRDREIIVYCQSGIRAANTYFVLKHILLYPRVRNYIGSWGEWGNRVDFEKYPVEK